MSKISKKHVAHRLSVKKHVAAIHINGTLSLVERKLANVLLLNAYDDLPVKGMTHTLPVSHLLAMLGWDESGNIEHLQRAIKTLAGTSVEFNVMRDGKTSWHAMAMIAYGAIEGGVCTYRYDEFLAGQLFNPEIYATINLGIQRLFESCYALALYENCLRYRRVGSTGWWGIEMFRELMGVAKDSYAEFKYLRKEVIGKPVQEINRVSDIRLEPEFKRRGRRVVEIRFLVSDAPQQEALKPCMDAHTDIRESELFTKLRSHGIGERLAIAWIRQDEARARATVEYVETKARARQIKGSTAGYIRTVFESGAEISQPSEFEAGQKAQAAEEADARKRNEAEKWRQSRAETNAIDQAKAAVLALTPEARRALAAEYRQGAGASASTSWDEAKGDFRSPMERIPFNLWMQKKFMPAVGEKEKAA